MRRVLSPVPDPAPSRGVTFGREKGVGIGSDLTTGSDNTAMLCLALAPVISAVIVVLVGHDHRLERIPSRASSM